MIGAKSLTAGLFIFLLMAGGNREATAQHALGDGRALDANPKVGTRGYNLPGRRSQAAAFSTDLALRNAIVTGNVGGGFGFRGEVGYEGVYDFRGELGSDDFFSFQAQTLPPPRPYPGAALMFDNYTATQRNLYWTVSGQYDGLVSSAPIIRRPGGGTAAAQVLGTAPAQVDISSFDSFAAMHNVLRSPSGLEQRELSGPELAGYQLQQAGQALQQPVAYLASDTMGLKPFTPQLYRHAFLSRDEQVRELARPASLNLPRLPGITDDNEDTATTPTPNQRPAQQLSEPVTNRLGGAATERVDADDGVYGNILESLRIDAQVAGEPAAADASEPTEEAEALRPEDDAAPEEQPAGAAGIPTFDPESATLPESGLGATDLIVEPDAQDGAMDSPAGATASDPIDTYQERLDRLRLQLSMPWATESLERDTIDSLTSMEDLSAAIETDDQDRELTEQAEVIDPAAARRARPEFDPNADLAALAEELLGDIAVPVNRLAEPKANAVVYSEHMAAGEIALREGRYFDAEERFTSALLRKPGDPMAAAGRINAQIGGGMYLSASSNLRRLLAAYPELAAVRFDAKLLPQGERLERVMDQLRYRGENTLALRSQAGLLLAYMGWQLEQQDDIAMGFRLIEAAAADAGAPVDAVVRVLQTLWLEGEGAGRGQGGAAETNKETDGAAP